VQVRGENTKNRNEGWNEMRRKNSGIIALDGSAKVIILSLFQNKEKKGCTRETTFSCVLCYKSVYHRLVLGEKGVTCKRL
jgi:hypothetical protein